MPVDSLQKQGRGPAGRLFRKGRSGNPIGRRPSCRTRATLAADILLRLFRLDARRETGEMGGNAHQNTGAAVGFLPIQASTRRAKVHSDRRSPN
jgi:hypothetical protein